MRPRRSGARRRGATRPRATWARALLAAGAGLAVTAGLYLRSAQVIARDTERQFLDLAAASITGAEHELNTYVEALISVASFAAASFPPTADGFDYVIDQTALADRYPALMGIALIERVSPEGTAQLEARLHAEGAEGFKVIADPTGRERLVITQSDDFRGRPLPRGFDVASVGGAALLEQPLDSLGVAFISVRQLAALGIPAFFMPAPTTFYAVVPVPNLRLPAARPESRRVAGWLAGPIEGARLLDHVVAQDGLAMSLSMVTADGDETVARWPDDSTVARATGPHAGRIFRSAGAVWDVDVHGAGFRAAHDGHGADVVAVAGVLLTLALATLIVVRGNARQRAAVLRGDLARHERWASTLLDSGSEPLAVFSAEGSVQYANAAAERCFGDGCDGSSLAGLGAQVDDEDRPKLERTLDELLASPGRTMRCAVHLPGKGIAGADVELAFQNLIDDPAVAGLVLTARDISEHKRVEDMLTYEASHDPLTGLANRTLLCDRLARALADGREGLQVGVLYVDLDGFKPINDALGHAAGDELLVGVARRLMGAVRAADTVARVGGDEFVVVCEALPDPATVLAVAEKIDDALATPIVAGDHAVTVSASIGVVVQPPGHDVDIADLLREADAAMYAAKAGGRHRIILSTANA